MAMDQANHSEASTPGNDVGSVSESDSDHSDADAPRAYLYRTTDTSVGWTVCIPWNAEDLIDLKHCPVSGEPVGMVCDGRVVADDNTKDETEPTVVRFKFGKKTYQLSTAGVLPQQATTNATTNTNTTTMPSGGGYGWLGSWWFGTTTAANVHNYTTSTQKPWLAQDRIAQALGLASLKILHKGRLLYDSKSDAERERDSTGVTHQEPTAVSQRLLAISEDDWKTPDTTKKKATLVVMGTRTQDQLKEPPPDKDAEGGGSRTAGPWNQGWLSIPFYLLRWTVKLTWHFVLSMTPFASLPDDPRQRPHQD